LLARSNADLDRVANRIMDAGGAATALPTDLADPAAVLTTTERIISDGEPPGPGASVAATLISTR
jgi:hypothetical protein